MVKSCIEHLNKQQQERRLNQVIECKKLSNKFWECSLKNISISECGPKYYKVMQCLDKLR
jgi:hypothetical protein